MLQLADLLAPHSRCPLGARFVVARGLMDTFWGWVGQNAPTGSLVKFKTETIAQDMAGWWGDPAIFVECLARVEFISPHPDGSGWVLTNYRWNADRHTNNKLARRGLRFWCGHPPRMGDLKREEQAKCKSLLVAEDGRRQARDKALLEALPKLLVSESVVVDTTTGEVTSTGTLEGTSKGSGHGQGQVSGAGDLTPGAPDEVLGEVLDTEKSGSGKQTGFPDWLTDERFCSELRNQCRELERFDQINWTKTLRALELRSGNSLSRAWPLTACRWVTEHEDLPIYTRTTVEDRAEQFTDTIGDQDREIAAAEFKAAEERAAKLGVTVEQLLEADRALEDSKRAAEGSEFHKQRVRKRKKGKAAQLTPIKKAIKKTTPKKPKGTK